MSKTNEEKLRRFINEEINIMIKGEYNIWFIKAQRLHWFGQVQKRELEDLIKKVYN